VFISGSKFQKSSSIITYFYSATNNITGLFRFGIEKSEIKAILKSYARNLQHLNQILITALYDHNETMGKNIDTCGTFFITEMFGGFTW
jgi:hypothetical protein